MYSKYNVMELIVWLHKDLIKLVTVSASSGVFLGETLFCWCGFLGGSARWWRTHWLWARRHCLDLRQGAGCFTHHQCFGTISANVSTVEKAKKKKKIRIIIEIVLTLPLKPWTSLKKGPQAAIWESQVYGSSKCRRWESDKKSYFNKMVVKERSLLTCESWN